MELKQEKPVRKDIDRFTGMSDLFRWAAVYLAVESGLLSYLATHRCLALDGEHQLRFPSIASGFDVIVEHLVAERLIHKRGYHLRLSADYKKFFDPASPVNQVASLLHSSHIARNWSKNLNDYLKTGTWQSQDTNFSSQSFFFRAMNAQAAPLLERLRQKIDLSALECVVDVGAGGGCYSRFFLEQNSGLRALLFEKPECIAQTLSFVRASGMSDRIDVIGRDFLEHSESIPPRSLYLLANILHMYGSVQMKRLLQRCCCAARSSAGRVLVIDYFFNSHADETIAALFNLHMRDMGDVVGIDVVRDVLSATGAASLKTGRLSTSRSFVLAIY